MSFLLSPVVANQNYGFRYVEDVFVIWLYEKNDLLFNYIYSKIQFTLELKENEQIIFLNNLVKKSLDSQVLYRKTTHTNRY